ncbi:MAG: ATP-binding protein [Desulfoprunum sp.]|nr:ATP-binding protein [Desulfoprunum sp.]
MHVPFLHRLSFVQARNVVLIAFLLGLITTGNQIRGDLLQARQESSSTVQQILQMQQQAAAQAAWSFDNTLAANVLEGLFKYSPTLEATIFSDISILAHKERKDAGTGKLDWLANQVIEQTEFTIQLYIPGKKEVIGTLSLRISSNLIARTFFDRTLRNILSTLLPLLILSFVLVLMFYYSLTKPLFHLSARLAEIDTEQPLQSPLEIPSGHQNDEFGLVVSTTNNLLFQFDQLLSRHTATEQELVVAEKKYRSIFDNALEGIYQTTLDGRFISANPFLAKVLGYETPEQLIEEITDIGSQLYVNRANRDEMLHQLVQDGHVRSYESQFCRKDGTILWGSQSTRVVRDEAGKVLYIEGMISDVTATKQAMADLARLEAQLMQAQKMEALGNLAGGVAHDFNNLLQIIAGYTQLLLIEKDQQNHDYKYLFEVNQAASRASELIRRMLTFSRKVNVEMIQLNLNDVILESLHLLERTLPKMVSIQTVLAADLAIIPADPTQMEQVIMNLANNAVQAMEDSGSLTIETENFLVREKYINTYLELDPGDYVLMKVTDTGKGMDEATRQRIFEPFFTTKEPGKGTGLGLASVYGIVTGHSGKITCYSEPGIGTTFKIFLPVTTVRGRSIPSTKTPAELTGGNETILLVDDEEVILAIAGDILEKYGYRTRAVHSGEEALELYNKDIGAIDLIIMDLGMAGMGGRKCLAELLLINPALKVIIASGYGNYDIINDPAKYGAAAFLSKPYRLDILVATVRGVLDRP